MSDITTHEDGSKTVGLDYPIEHKGRTIDEVTLRRPKTKDLRAWDKVTGDVARSALMVGLLGDLSQPEVDLLDASDFMRVAQAAGDFLPAAPATGAS